MSRITEENFIEHCMFILNRKGYHGVNTVSQRESTGVDILARKTARRFAVSCILSERPVGADEVRAIHLNKDTFRCPFAMIMTNAAFDEEAKEVARSLEVELMERVPEKRSSTDKVITRLIFLVIMGAALVYCVTRFFG